MQDRPVVLLGAAGAQAAEAAGVAIASVLSALDTAAGKSYHVSSGIALTVIAFATAAFLAVVALGLARARPWSRTPALLSQLFTLIAGIILLQGHRVEWGAPAVALALAGSVALLVPPSLQALTRAPRAPRAPRTPPAPRG